jgi:pyruvate formate lyase activating enzyme
MTERPSVNAALRAELLERTAPGKLWEKLDNKMLRCFSCGHRCRIPEGFDGVCKVRSNVGGELRVPWGYAAGIQLDPIEKKPFFHALPGVSALSFGMLGCDFHCAYCQNWMTSQSLRDLAADARPRSTSPEELVELALANGARVLTSTYNEPLITAEWAAAIFEKAREQSLWTSFVSNGNGTKEVIDFLRPLVDFYKVDLKGFRDKAYRQLGGVLSNVTDTIERLHSAGIWLEIVTLLVPGFNDGEEEIRDLTAFLKGVSPDIPWHVTAFHPDYKMTDRDRTTVDSILRSAEIGKEAGLHFVYAGNLHGRVGDWESTFCPHCKARVVERRGFRVLENRMKGPACPDCAKPIAGVWRDERARRA